MDASPERKRKSVKGRRRSLRNLQPADLVESHNDLTATSQLYGSIWLDQSETPPMPVIKPRRRSVSNAGISHHLNKENVYKHLEKGTFNPESTPSKRVEIAPEKTPVLCTAKGSDYFMKNACNNENDHEEIAVANFWQRDQDASMSAESFKKTADILATDENHIKCKEETINHSIKDELQLSDDFSEKEQSKTNLSNKSLTLDQLTAECLIELVTSVREEMVPLSHQDYFSDSVNSCSGSTNNLVDNLPSLASPSETQIHHSCLPILSGDQISSIPQKNSLPFSTDLCQDFQQLDISENVCTENDQQRNTLNEGFGTRNQNSPESLLASDSSPLDNDFSLNKGFYQMLNSYSNSDVSSLNDTTLESLSLYETDLSSAGSELSESWCFSRHFNSANDFDSTPYKADDSKMSLKIDNGYFVESVKDLIFPSEDEIKKIDLETVASSSVRMPMKEEENLPAIEYLSLDNHYPSDLNKEHQTHMHEKSQIEGTGFCVTSNDESVKILPSKNFQKNLTKILDSKIPKLKPSSKGAFLSTTKKTTNKSNNSSSNQSTLNTMDNNGFTDVTKLTSSRTEKKSAAVNIQKSDKYSTDPNKLKSTRLNKNLHGEKSLSLGGQNSYKQPSALENKSRNAIQVEKSKSKFQQKTVSPDVLIFDSSKRPPHINITQTMKSKTKAAKNVNQLSEFPSAEKQRPLKKISESLPTVKMPHEDKNLNQSPLHKTYQQEDSQPATLSTDEVRTKTYCVETLSKQKWLKGSNASTSFDQTSSVTTPAAETNRCSYDIHATSNITIKRRNTKAKKKSINTTCDAEVQPDFGSEKNIIIRQTSNQCMKLKSLPVLETADVAVVDLESSVCSDGDDIFNKPVAKIIKRRCKSIGSANFSIDKSFLNDDDGAIFAPTYIAVSHEDKQQNTTQDGEAESVSLTEEPLEMLNDIATESPHLTLVNDITPKKPRKPTRTKRKSTGSIPANISQNKEATCRTQSDSASSEPVMILEESFHVAHSQKQTALRRSTRRSSIELSLSSNAKHLSAVAKTGKNQTSTCAQSTEKTSDSPKRKDDDYDDDYENERLREIYAKKPYVPIFPTRLETIYSPNKKRNDKNVFGKRKISRTLTFKPSEAQIKNRQKKAMRNWPFLFMVPDSDEKLNKLLNITEVKRKRKN